MFRSTAEWIASTPLSNELQVVSWVVPTSQSIHICCVGVLFFCSMRINARLLGFGAQGQSAAAVIATMSPRMRVALLGLLITGTIQTIAEPVRQFVTPVFWWKMAMILVVMALSEIYFRKVTASGGTADEGTAMAEAGKVFAVCSVVLWAAIVVCGRFIGYTWAYYT